MLAEHYASDAQKYPSCRDELLQLSADTLEIAVAEGHKCPNVAAQVARWFRASGIFALVVNDRQTSAKTSPSPHGSLTKFDPKDSRWAHATPDGRMW